MNKYTNCFLSTILNLLLVFLVVSCDSEYYTIEGYVSGGAYSGNQCEEGQEGKKICKNDPGSGFGTLYTCHNQLLTDAEPCLDNYSCNGNLCGECTNHINVCKNDESSKAGIQSTCEDGKKHSSKCPNNNSCDGNVCGECINDTFKCTDGKYGVCVEGKYKRYDCSIFGFDVSSECKVVDVVLLKFEGCGGLGNSSMGNGKLCYQDNELKKAYKLKWINVADIGGGVSIESICPTEKCNANASGCEDDPVVEPSQGE